MVRDLIGKAAAPAERVLGVGVSMPGTFSADGSLMLDSRVLRMQNLRCAELSRSIPLPCVFCNDANAAVSRRSGTCRARPTRSTSR